VTFAETVDSHGLSLAAHLARPSQGGSGAALVLCHGFPAGPGGAATSAQTYPELADRLAAETGWTVLVFTFRGAGGSQGNFSLGGWRDDIVAAVDKLAGDSTVRGVWLAGSSTGGALALCAAAVDARVRGVATLAAPAAFDDWAANAHEFLATCRDIGVVRDPAYPPNLDVWARELREIRPLDVIGDLVDRSLLIMHGADDDVVSLADARALADASHGTAELRVINGAGHRLRHDPRAVALLTGWMERQPV
jgi:alpha/beta superfamily hydrolase